MLMLLKNNRDGSGYASDVINSIRLKSRTRTEQHTFQQEQLSPSSTPQFLSFVKTCNIWFCILGVIVLRQHFLFNAMFVLVSACRSYYLEDILLLLVYVYSLVGDESSDSQQEESKLQVILI